MAKILLFQHVPYEPLGIISPLIRSNKHRVRYINFSRHPHAKPQVTQYDALVILGGPPNVDQTDIYPYLLTEMRAIEKALKLGLPVLGICLGAQLIAHTLGASVYRAEDKEIGWYKLTPTPAGQVDRMIQHFKPEEQIFEWHGYTFDVPLDATLLVEGEGCVNQAFRYGDKTYGLQFHLEIDEPLIHRWISLPQYQNDLRVHDRDRHTHEIVHDTEKYIARSLSLGEQVFQAFIDLLPQIDKQIILPSI